MGEEGGEWVDIKVFPGWTFMSACRAELSRHRCAVSWHTGMLSPYLK
jgi:hypothetical protein